MAPRLLRVELLVCTDPTCRRVGKIPLSEHKTIKGWCTGGASNPHKKARMAPTNFVEERGS